MPAGDGLASRQHAHWQQTYRAQPGLYGMEPSSAAVHAVDVFSDTAAAAVLDLGAGHGRDTVFFASTGLFTYALDDSAEGLAQLRAHAQDADLTDRVETIEHDVREALPLADDSVDGVFAHMLLCMALSSTQIHELMAEVRRVLRPCAALVYTVRHTGDAHYGAGTAYGDNIFEYGGFAVHFFDRALVDALAVGWNLMEVHPFDEGALPRRLWRVTQTKPSPGE